MKTSKWMKECSCGNFRERSTEGNGRVKRLVIVCANCGRYPPAKIDYQNPYANIPEDNEDVILKATNIKSSGIIEEPMTEAEDEAMRLACETSNYLGADKATGADFTAIMPTEGMMKKYHGKKSEDEKPKTFTGKLLDFKVLDTEDESKRKQLKIDKVRLAQAEAESMNSNCVKHSVGCIITDAEGRILSSGYNGSPAGHQNCCEKFPKFKENFSKLVSGVVDLHAKKVMEMEHREWSMQHEIHAEVNAIMASDPIRRKGGTLYVNLQPCENCAKMIAASGVKRVVYGKAYHRANNAVSEKLFADSGIEYTHIKIN